jgi:hypothetical protein
MHDFEELVYRSTAFTLHSIELVNKEILKELETSAPTYAIKNLQMLQLQKVILAIGMFSMFDAILQDSLLCKDGFKQARQLLLKKGETLLHERFDLFITAINVLKHGRGRSYDTLVAKAEILPFKIKMPNENFFFEGDVSEVSTLVEVNNEFLLNCADLIYKIASTLKDH